jgi:L-serine/L-threonine ammonia-lyase
MNVELACGAALSVAYTPGLLEKIIPRAKTVVFIVCGGAKVSIEEISQYQAVFSRSVSTGKQFGVLYEGETWYSSA